MSVTAKMFRRRSGQTSELRREMALAGKTQTESYIGQRRFFFPKKLLGALDLLFHYVLQRRVTGRLFEHPRKVKWAHSDRIGDVRESHAVLKAVADKIGGPPKV